MVRPMINQTIKDDKNIWTANNTMSDDKVNNIITNKNIDKGNFIEDY